MCIPNLQLTLIYLLNILVMERLEKGSVNELKANGEEDLVTNTKTVSEVEIEEELPIEMTASYSEIPLYSHNEDSFSKPFKINNESRKQDNLSLEIDGYIHYEGDMTHYVADDLEFKIKLSSPVTKKAETASFGSISEISTPNDKSKSSLPLHCSHVNISILNDLEREAQNIAQSVDNLIENLSGILHTSSSLTADNMEVYKDAVGKTCDAMDSNIKSMYTILAKGEEVSQAMLPVQAQAQRIAEIKSLVQMLENLF